MAKQFLTGLNLNKNEILNARIQNLATAPSNPVAGQIYFDTDTNQLTLWDGTAWVSLAAGGNVGEAIQSAIDAIDTDDIEEGSSNLYYQTSRAKTDAAELLTGATLTNITITGDGSGLTITAENGVADSDTDDLAEGTTNLYYTDGRARGAISAGDGIDYNSTTGVVSANVGYGLELSGGQIVVDSIIATNTYVGDAINDHNVSSGVHGVTGDVVGTTDSQTLTNKAFTGTVGLGVNGSAIEDTAGALEVYAAEDLTLVSNGGNVVLSADGSIYKGSSDPSNELTTLGVVNTFIGDGTVDGSTGNTITDRIATAVSNLVDGAPDLLNTLNELAAAINDDESFSSTITTSIGEKVAKSGDTMTGALTLSGAPTSDLHAATKAYVDTEISDAIAAAAPTTKYAASNTSLTATSGAVTWTVTHNLGTRDVTVQVFDLATYDQVEVDVVRTSTSVVTLSWVSGDVLADSYRVVVVG